MYFVSGLPTNDEVSAANRHLTCLGGRGVVPALVVSALGIRASLCTVIGLDARAEFEPFLSANGVGTDSVKWDHGSSTTAYVAFIDESGGGSLAVAHPARLDWTPTDAQRNAVLRGSVVYFSTNDLGFNATLLSLVDPAEQIVVHNLGVRIRTNPSYLESMLAKTTILIGNGVEIGQLTAQIAAGPNEILERTKALETIIVTRGRDDILVYRKGERRPQAFAGRKIPHPVSPVGAGDSLAAGLLVTLARDGNFEDGLALGIELGALAVQSDLSYPDLRQVAALAP
jgi:sugar/nucleoside kinase (ribokinase family)